MFPESVYLKNVFDNSIMPVTVYDQTGKIIYFNCASARLYDKPDVFSSLFNTCSKEVMKKLFVHKRRNGEEVLIQATCINTVKEGYSYYVVMSNVLDINNQGIRGFMYYNIEKNPLLLYSDGRVEAYNSLVMEYLDCMNRKVDVERPGETEGTDRPAEQYSAGLEAKTLTKRESDILFLLYKAFSVRDISENLSISVNTVKTHLKKMYRKFSVQNRMQLISRIFINSD